MTEYVPRFNYNDYMRSLNDRLSTNVAHNMTNASFQRYIMKEREAYLKSVHEVDTDLPLLASLSHFRSSHAPAGGDEASFNLGSLQYDSHIRE